MLNPRPARRRKNAPVVTHAEIKAALQNFLLQGGRIRVLPAQANPSRWELWVEKHHWEFHGDFETEMQ